MRLSSSSGNTFCLASSPNFKKLSIPFSFLPPTLWTQRTNHQLLKCFLGLFSKIAYFGASFNFVWKIKQNHLALKKKSSTKVGLNSFIESSVHWKSNLLKKKKKFLLVLFYSWPTEPSTKIALNRQRVFYEWHSWLRCTSFVSPPWHSFGSMGKLIYNKRCSIVLLVILAERSPGWRVPGAQLPSLQPAFATLFSWMVKFKSRTKAFALQSFSFFLRHVCTRATRSCLYKVSDEPTITLSVLKPCTLVFTGTPFLATPSLIQLGVRTMAASRHSGNPQIHSFWNLCVCICVCVLLKAGPKCVLPLRRQYG